MSKARHLVQGALRHRQRAALLPLTPIYVYSKRKRETLLGNLKTPRNVFLVSSEPVFNGIFPMLPHAGGGVPKGLGPGVLAETPARAAVVGVGDLRRRFFGEKKNLRENVFIRLFSALRDSSWRAAGRCRLPPGRCSGPLRTCRCRRRDLGPLERRVNRGIKSYF